MATAQPVRICEFWAGRAGSGKTFGCLAAIADELRRAPRGHPLIFLVPEQATAQIERRLATWPGLIGGFTRARVVSFQHLSRQALAAAGHATNPSLGETGRVMLFRHALRLCQPELKVFTGASTQPGLAEAVSRALLEFQRYGWSPDQLDAWVRTLPELQRNGDRLARKLADLARLWRTYDEALARGGWQDNPSWSRAATGAIAHWDALAGSRVWVDGFASFTALELDLLFALLGHADHAVIALALDPSDLAGPPRRERVGPERLFENTKDTYSLLKDRFEAREWTTRLVHLPLDDAPTRFQSPALAHLEASVLGRLRPQTFHDEPSRDPLSAPIQLIEAADRRAELEAVARRIVALCRSRDSAPPGLTWRDVGVLARDLAPYESLIREVFAQFEIPFFLDLRRGMSGHPLARLLLSALVVLRSKYSGAEVIHHLKTGLAALRNPDRIADLENHILRIDPAGPTWRDMEPGESSLRDAWSLAEKPLLQLEKNLRGKLNPAQALWKFIETLEVPAALDQWIADAQSSGDEELAQLHEQAWSATISTLEELEALAAADPTLFAAADFPARLDDLSALLESALATTEARLIPPTLNQVTVGAVDRSRTPEIDTLFVLGLNEGEFPRLWSPDAMLGDLDRDRLATPSRPLGPDTAAKRRQEHFLAYIALTRPSRRLVLSRPLAADDGKPADPSPIFLQVAESFPAAPRLVIARSGEGDEPALGLRAEEWNLRLAAAVSRLGSPARAADLASLMAAGDPADEAGLPPGKRGAILAGRRQAFDPQPAELAPALAEAFWTGRDELRVTALEQFGACPFKFHAAAVLGLEERETGGLSPMDFGTIRHQALDAIYQNLKSEHGLAWGSLNLDRADQVIDAAFAAAAGEARTARLLRASPFQALALDRASRELKLAVRAMRRVAETGAFRQIASEWEFKGDRALPITIEGKRFLVRGKVDRIDRLDAPGPPVYLLFDYKSGQRRLDLTRIFGAIDLQLLAYALALSEGTAAPDEADALYAARRRIGGLFYWPLSLPLIDADESPAADLISADFLKKSRPVGIFAADIAASLDASVPPGASSPTFGFRRNKDNSLGAASQAVWDPRRLDQLLAHERRLLAETLQAIHRGDIHVGPFRHSSVTACDGCAYALVCRKADTLAGAPAYRILATMKRDTAYAFFDGAAQGDEEDDE